MMKNYNNYSSSTRPCPPFFPYAPGENDLNKAYCDTWLKKKQAICLVPFGKFCNFAFNAQTTLHTK